MGYTVAEVTTMAAEFDLHGKLQLAATERMALATSRLNDLVSELARLDALETVCRAEDGDLVREITARRAALSAEIVATLAGWRGAGASIQLVLDAVRVVSVAHVTSRPSELGDSSSFPAVHLDATHQAEPSTYGALELLAPTTEKPVSSNEHEPPPAKVIVDTTIPERPAPPPATREALLALRAHVSAGGHLSTTDVPANWGPGLAAILRDLGPPCDADDEIERLLDAVRTTGRWTVFPREVQCLLVGLLAARLRRLQDEVGAFSGRMNECFSMLTAYSAREQPGFVLGLQRSHRPIRETWLDDADAYWEQLTSLVPLQPADAPNRERLLARIESLAREIGRAPAQAKDAVRSQVIREIRGALATGVSARDPRLLKVAAPLVDALTGPEYRVLRRAIREEFAEQEEESAETFDPIPADWAWWSRTRAKRAVMVGGSPRELNRQRLERAFEFTALEWHGAEYKRNGLQAIRDRVAAGTIDLIIILARFVGHDADHIILPACREHGVAWVNVDHGYGVDRIRRAIERFTEPEGAVAAVVALRPATNRGA